MKIAAVTDDGQTISAHFGRAYYYLVITVEDGQATGREMREKAGHHQFHQEHDHDHSHRHEDARGHGFGPGAQSRHARMVATISDCDVLLARGMGGGIYQDLQQAGIQPVLTTVAGIDEAVSLYLAGRLEDHPERLH
jgi:predicted Fe-Mo cluster-binding NifX family protein